jgi:hypothetical protein
LPAAFPYLRGMAFPLCEAPPGAIIEDRLCDVIFDCNVGSDVEN